MCVHMYVCMHACMYSHMHNMCVVYTCLCICLLTSARSKDQKLVSVFKPGACQPLAGTPGFLQLFLCGRLYACLCVRPEAVNNYGRDLV